MAKDWQNVHGEILFPFPPIAEGVRSSIAFHMGTVENATLEAGTWLRDEKWPLNFHYQ
jgi:hypothetical protein